MKTKIPSEILHWTERAEYHEWKRERKMAFIENTIFALLVIVLVALSFYCGRLVERHFAPNDSVKKTHYQSNGAKFIKI